MVCKNHVNLLNIVIFVELHYWDALVKNIIQQIQQHFSAFALHEHLLVITVPITRP